MSLTLGALSHDDLLAILVASAVIGCAVIAGLVFFDWNDEEWFKTLDKLTCEEIWEMMMNGNPDWDTIEYYGDRC